MRAGLVFIPDDLPHGSSALSVMGRTANNMTVFSETRMAEEGATARFCREFALTLVGKILRVVCLPVLALLIILEPIVVLVSGGLALLGVLSTILFMLIGAPNFPWATMLAISLGFAFALIPYYALIRVLSR
jgi:hypothetical protein